MDNGDFSILSLNRSVLLRNRMMDVCTNHLLLQIESNSFSDSCMRFCKAVRVRVRMCYVCACVCMCVRACVRACVIICMPALQIYVRRMKSEESEPACTYIT